MKELNPPAAVRAVEDLARLAEKINAGHAAVEKLAGKSLEKARETGELLLKAKAQCGHGKWLKWLKENVEFSQQTASNYVRIAKGWE